MNNKHILPPPAIKLLKILFLILILFITIISFVYANKQEISKHVSINRFFSTDAPNGYHESTDGIKPLRNTSIIFNGDSITEGNIRHRYVDTLKRLLKFKRVRNYAVSGSTLAHTDHDTNALVDRYMEMPNDCDIVFLMMNTNDYSYQVPIGSDDTLDTSTYTGAMNILFPWLKDYYSDKVILIATMPTRNVEYDEYGNPLEIPIDAYADAIIRKCNEYDIPVFDTYHLATLDIGGDKDHIITDDNLHPNTLGAEILGRSIAKFICSNYKEG